MAETLEHIEATDGGAGAEPVRVIATDAEAIEVARSLAALLAEGAARRDSERRLPREEIEWFSRSGLWGITVPKAYGGAGVSFVTLTEVVKLIAAADPSLGQLPQNHFGLVDVIALTGTDEQKRYLFGEVLAGKDPHGQYLPASTLKTLTSATLVTKLDPNRLVRPSQKACDVEGTKVGLTPSMRYMPSSPLVTT